MYFVDSKAPPTLDVGNSRIKLRPLLTTETVTVTVEPNAEEVVVGSGNTLDVAAAVIPGTVVFALDIVELA